jgi:hypothetical protein
MPWRKMKAGFYLNSVEYPLNSYEETEEGVLSSSSFWEDTEYFREGFRFVKGCLWASLLNIPLWVIIWLILF